MSDQQNEQQKEMKEFLRVRREKLEKLRQEGVNPYPYGFEFTHTASSALEEFGDTDKETLAEEKHQVAVSGRILSLRVMGKASFCHISDGRVRLQCYIRRDDIGEENYRQFKACYEVGDFIGVRGYMFRTRTEELSVHAESIEFLSKSLRPLPEKWHGLSDVETRYRQRYLDLIANTDSREIFEQRSRIIQKIRSYYTENGFLEVETPMMQPLYGGAAARPFVTHHNALDMQLYLRIAPELYLKRLVAGGFDRVFEINRNFRNEGISTQHNPEFTMLESYQAYADYNDVMAFTETMIHKTVLEVTGGSTTTFGDLEIDWTPPWPRKKLVELAMEHSGATEADFADVESLAAFYKKKGIEVPKGASKGKMIYELFETYGEPTLQQPTFVIDFPIEVSPLTKVHRDNPELVERFELFVSGLELANAFSELNDPDDQRARFEDQLNQRDSGDDEAHQMDEDYIRAMEYGMPPMGGLGIGIDRLTMLITGAQSIRDVILFPLLRNQ